MAGKFKIVYVDSRPDEEVEADKWEDQGPWIDFQRAFRTHRGWDVEQVLRVQASIVMRIERTSTSDRQAAPS